jgi:glycosyltransferase involved in cell wall biosynthesis
MPTKSVFEKPLVQRFRDGLRSLTYSKRSSIKLEILNENTVSGSALPKVCFVWNYLSWGGAQIYFLAIMKAARDSWDLKVILPRESSPEILRFIEENGVPIEFIDDHLDYSIPADTILKKVKRQFRRITVEAKTFKHLLRYDVRNTIFHIEIAPWQSVVFLTAMSLRGAKVFVTLHNFIPKVSRLRELSLKSRMWIVSNLPGLHIFASNNDTKNRFKGWVTDRFWQDIRVTFTGINPIEIESVVNGRLDQTAMRERHCVPPDKFVVLCVGQFIDRKGRWVFLDAAREILKTASDIQFVWLTPKPPTAEETTKIDDYGLGDSFQLVLSESVGTNRSDVLSFFRIADAFALPSYIEGLPIALLEAMALKLPCISTNVFAIPEAVKHLETGLLIEPGDGVALANAILMLKNDGDLRERLGKNGSVYVQQHFDERDSANIAIKAYKECFSNAR